MKRKVVILAVFVAFLAGVLCSCSNEICPAYADNNEMEQVDINS